MSFSDAIDLGIIFIGLYLSIVTIISMRADNKKLAKLVKALAENETKTIEQNKLLETQNALLQEKIKILKRESNNE